MKEGRQPGLSLVVASQQPAVLDVEVLSQCDVMISHALTTAVDSVDSHKKRACPHYPQPYDDGDNGVLSLRVL